MHTKLFVHVPHSIHLLETAMIVRPNFERALSFWMEKWQLIPIIERPFNNILVRANVGIYKRIIELSSEKKKNFEK